MLLQQIKKVFSNCNGTEITLSITLSRIGYKKKTVLVSESPTKIELDPVTQDLDEVVVVGYGTQKNLVDQFNRQY
jgi:hypothetical protein